MHTIRKGEPRDIAAIAVIYDRILDREERGGASTGRVRGGHPTADTARAAPGAGGLFRLGGGGPGAAGGPTHPEEGPPDAPRPPRPGGGDPPRRRRRSH